MTITERTGAPSAPSGAAADATSTGAGPTTPATHTSRGARVLSAVMDNPLVGLSPWILYSLVEGEGRLELSAALALGLAVLILFVNWFRGSRPKMLEFSDVVYFAALAVIVALASEGTRTWLEMWGGETANMALFLLVLGTVLIRRPFTLQYAKESTPEEYWHTPQFLHVNYVISWVWVAAFAIEAASGLFGDAVLEDPNNIWTGWIIQTFPMIVAAQFTIWYPNRYEAVLEGRTDEMPTVADFLGTVCPWVTVIGIIVLYAGGAPEWLGIALIVAGIALTRLFTMGTKGEGTGSDRAPDAPARA
jgi:hypothetical protein